MVAPEIRMRRELERMTDEQLERERKDLRWRLLRGALMTDGQRAWREAVVLEIRRRDLTQGGCV